MCCLQTFKKKQVIIFKDIIPRKVVKESLVADPAQSNLKEYKPILSKSELALTNNVNGRRKQPV